MHAAVIDNKQLQVLARPDPVPGDTELLVEVVSAGVNGADPLQVAGFYPAPTGWPADIPGMELAGTVVAVGPSVDRWRIGDRVMGVVGGGAQASLALIDQSHALAVPDDLDLAIAGGFPEVFTTAFDALILRAKLSAGQRVLITGASGGVGSAAVQIADCAGAHVVASTRHGDHTDSLRQLGAEIVIAPEEMADHGPYDVVLELVGSSSLATVVGSLALESRVVVIGVGGGGSKLELDLLGLMNRRAAIMGATLRSRSAAEKAVVAAALSRRMLPLLERGDLQVVVAERFSLNEVAAAYDRFRSGAKLGKIIINP